MHLIHLNGIMPFFMSFMIRNRKILKTKKKTKQKTWFYAPLPQTSRLTYHKIHEQGQQEGRMPAHKSISKLFGNLFEGFEPVNPPKYAHGSVHHREMRPWTEGISTLLFLVSLHSPPSNPWFGSSAEHQPTRIRWTKAINCGFVK